MKFRELLILALVLVACDAFIPNDASRRAQADVARAAQEVACQRHLVRLLELRDQHVPCEKAKDMAATEHPLCNLSFTCPARDAGPMLEAGAE